MAAGAAAPAAGAAAAGAPAAGAAAGAAGAGAAVFGAGAAVFGAGAGSAASAVAAASKTNPPMANRERVMWLLLARIIYRVPRFVVPFFRATDGRQIQL